MAVDTAAKRGSALNFGTDRVCLPWVDGSVGHGDMQHLLGCYSGILATVPSAIVLPWVVAAMRRPETGMIVGRAFQSGGQVGRLPKVGVIEGRVAKFEE